MNQHEITERRPLLDASGNLTEPGYAKSLLPVYRRGDIKANKLTTSSVSITPTLGWRSASRSTPRIFIRLPIRLTGSPRPLSAIPMSTSF